MGIFRRHSIAVLADSSKLEALTRLHAFAVKLFGRQVTPILPSVTNGDTVFFIGPDGSKEGWEESNQGDFYRDVLIQQISQHFKGIIRYCEFSWADDGHNPEILRHSEEEDSK